MQFDYEVPVEEFAAAQVLYYRAFAKSQVVKRAAGWGLLGLFFVLIAIFRWAADWPPILLLLTGVWFIYAGITILFPARHYRRYYSQSGLAGKKYHAELDENGFAVSGDGCSWRVLWTEARRSKVKTVASSCSAARVLFSSSGKVSNRRAAKRDSSIRRFAVTLGQKIAFATPCPFPPNPQPRCHPEPKRSGGEGPLHLPLPRLRFAEHMTTETEMRHTSAGGAART